MVTLFAQLDGRFPGIDGFLGTRGSLMLDVVFLAMFAIVPALGWSVWLVASRRKYALHKRIQLTLAGVLFLAVAAFELDMRFFTDWELRAAPSPYYAKDTWDAVWISLSIHLVFAVPTLVLWIVVLYGAWRGFPEPPTPSPHSRRHRWLGKLASVGMLLTAVTGWVFYYLAFVA